MGVVFEAKDELLKKTVAIKTIRKGFIQGDHIIRFQQEAKALASLNHPGLVPLYLFGLTDDNEPYMVMQFEKGTTMADLIRGRGHLPLSRSLNIFIQIADAMQHAHSHGVLHRDLKPSNIMIRGSLDAPVVVVLDFGVAMIEAGDAIATLTKTGMIIGTPTYMSPEQVKGRNIDARTDVYALGCIMFETLTGKPPFSATTALELLSKKSTSGAPSLNSIDGKAFPKAIAEIVATALAADVNERYQSMKELKNDLLAFRSGEYGSNDAGSGDSSHYQDIHEPRARLVTFNKFTVLSIIAGSVLAIVSTALFVASSMKPPPANTTATQKLDATDFIPEAVTFHHHSFSAQNLESEQKFKSALKLCARKEFIVTISAKYSSINCECLDDEDMKSVLGSVKELTADKCSVSEKGMIALSTLPALTHLHVRADQLTASGIAALKDAKLKVLDLEQTSLSPGAEDQIFRLHTIRGLFLSLIPTVQDDYIERLVKNMPQLEQLNLQGSGVTHKCLKSLQRLRNLGALNINSVMLDDSDVRLLSEFPALEILEIRGNPKLSLQSLKTLAKLEKLYELSLDVDMPPEKKSELEKAFLPRTGVVKFTDARTRNNKELEEAVKVVAP